MMSYVIGAKGFLGQHLCKALVARGDTTIGHDLPIIDIRQPYIDRPPQQIFENTHTVYHLAGLSNIVPSIKNPRDYFEANVVGTFNVLEAARLAGVKKFVYAASSGCYGANPEERLTENSPCYPAQPYALTKYLGEQMVMHWGKVYGMDVACVRIFNAYGPGCLTKTTCPSMLNIFMAQKANNKPLTIVGDGTQSRDWVYVDDVVAAFMLVAEKGTGIYNLGTGKPTSVKRIAEIIGGETIHMPERGGEPHTIYADNSRLRGLGWEPKVSIEEGLSLMMENLDYWKNEKVFTADSLQGETKAWSEKLKAS